MVYHLYITNKNYSSWSLRPWLLLRELGIPFEEKMHFLDGKSPRQPHWKAFSPTAHVPCLHDILDDGNTGDSIILWESLSIVEQIAEDHPDKHVYPSQSRAARAWARSAIAEMHVGFQMIRDRMSMNIGMRIQFPDDETLEEGLKKELRRVDELWAEGLEKFGGPFLAGKEFTAVDAFFAPVVLRFQTFVGSEKWLGEKAREYTKRVLELGGIKEW